MTVQVRLNCLSGSTIHSDVCDRALRILLLNRRDFTEKTAWHPLHLLFTANVVNTFICICRAVYHDVKTVESGSDRSTIPFSEAMHSQVLWVNVGDPQDLRFDAAGD